MGHQVDSGVGKFASWEAGYVNEVCDYRDLSPGAGAEGGGRLGTQRTMSFLTATGKDAGVFHSC